MALAYDATRVTRDVDSLFVPHGIVLEEARNVAKDLGMPPWWLNEQASVYISGKDDPGKRRVFDHPGLRVTAASPRHIFAMKAFAARTRDIDDLRLLADIIGMDSSGTALQICAEFFPGEEVPPRSIAILQELFRLTCNYPIRQTHLGTSGQASRQHLQPLFTSPGGRAERRSSAAVRSTPPRRRTSESGYCRSSGVVKRFVVYMVRSQTAGEVVMPSRGPGAKADDRWDIQAVLSEVFVGEHADAAKVIQDGPQVEGRLVAAGEILDICVGESICDGMQVDDVADHEPVMPGPRLQADRVVQRDSAHARPGRQLDRDPAWAQRFLSRSISSSSSEPGSHSTKRAYRPVASTTPRPVPG